MELGKEQNVPVISEPYSVQEDKLLRTGDCINVELNNDDLAILNATLVEGVLGGHRVYARYVLRLLPRYEDRLRTARSNAAQRILAHYACREDDPSA